MDTTGTLDFMRGFNEISDEEWRLLAPLLQDAGFARRQRGRPRAQDRVVANAILWLLTTGEPWSRLPQRYPSVPTCRCRYDAWRTTGALARMIQILLSTGRTFHCGPQTVPGSHSAPSQPGVRQVRDVNFRQVIWKSQPTWQAPGATALHSQSMDSLTEMTRQLAGPENVVPTPVESQPPLHALTNMQRSSEMPASPWRGLASRGKPVFDPRGYVIYINADVVRDSWFRGWAEIVRDERRLARSGLIGPRFTSRAAAQQFALEWARQWLEERDRSDEAEFDAADCDVPQRNVRFG